MPGRGIYLSKLYDEIEGTDIDSELVADLVGDYLFQDEAFVRNLSTENPGLFKKMWNAVKNFLKSITPGSKEAKQLEEIKQKFENVYRERANSSSETAKSGGQSTNASNENAAVKEEKTVPVGNSDVRYSITEPFTDSNGNQFENAVLLDSDFFDGISPRNWGEKLREAVEKRATENPVIMPIKDENGNTTLLQFANPNERVSKNGGLKHKVLNELSATNDNISKLAVVHIDEIVSVSNESSPYHTDENTHDWLDKNGWLHRNADVINSRNGNIYNLTFDIGKSADGRTILYAVNGKIKKVGNANVNSLKIKGSRQNSNYVNSIPQNPSNVNSFSENSFDNLKSFSDSDIAPLPANEDFSTFDAPVGDSDVKYSLTGINEDGIEVYETSEKVKNLSNKERMKLFENIMNNEYRGRTAKFEVNGQAYYAMFDSNDISKNIYGDKKSSASGWKAKIKTGADGNIFELVENSEYVGNREEYGKLTEAHSGVTDWDYFVKTVQIDNTVFNVLANVRKKSDGEYVYSITLRPNKKIRVSPPIGIKNDSVMTGAQHSYENSIPQNSSNVNSFSENSFENLKSFSDSDIAPLPANEDFPTFDAPVGDSDVKYSLMSTPDGNMFTVISKDSIDSLMAQKGNTLPAKVRSYFRKYRNTVLNLGNESKAYIRRESENEYTNPAKRLSDDIFDSKLKASSELENLLSASEFSRHSADDGRHPDAVRGWDYYDTVFAVPTENGYRIYSGEVSVKLISRGDCFYDITKIKDITDGTDGQAYLKAAISEGNVFDNSIPQHSSNVNTFSENSFDDVEKFKASQFEIIEKSNKAPNSYLTWIRSVDDIKTFEETLSDSDWSGGDDFDPSYSWQMAQEALESGEITVYSSYPIKQGVFVTPSRMEAESYSRQKNVYSKKIKLDEVAWIDPTQGMYANVEGGVKNSLSDSDIAPLPANEDFSTFDVLVADSDVKYSLGETADGRFVAIVDDDILKNIDTTVWDKKTKESVKKAASEALKQFKDGIVVDGIKRKVNKTSRNEYTRSNYTEELFRDSTKIFADKMRAADVADDIIVATTNWNRDGGLKHPRKDNFVDFDHGNTLIASGNSKYIAEVVVGITADGEAVFYDVVDMQPAEFEIKKSEPSTAATTQKNAIGNIYEEFAMDSIPQNSSNVNSFSENSFDDLKSFSDSDIAPVKYGDFATPARDAYLEDIAPIGENVLRKETVASTVTAESPLVTAPQSSVDTVGNSASDNIISQPAENVKSYSENSSLGDDIAPVREDIVAEESC